MRCAPRSVRRHSPPDGGEVKMAVWNMKGCPRCGGDTFLDEDLGAVYEHCLLCGYSRQVPVKNLRSVKPPARKGR